MVAPQNAHTLHALESLIFKPISYGRLQESGGPKKLQIYCQAQFQFASLVPVQLRTEISLKIKDDNTNCILNFKKIIQTDS